jgi:putative ABC transport system permease protein
MRRLDIVLYRILLRAFPARVRREFGDDMAAMFREQLLEARSAGVGSARIWTAAVLDALTHGLAERSKPLIAGSAGVVRETRRWRWWMHALLEDIRYSIRLMTKQPAVTAIAIVTLALGIGANTAIFSAVNAVLLRPLPYPEPSRLMTIWEKRAAEGVQDNVVSPADFLDWARLNSTFESMAAQSFMTTDLTGVGDPTRLPTSAVSPSFFRVIGVQPALGRQFRDDEATVGRHRVAILSHVLWTTRFGSNPGIVGQTVQLSGIPHEVVGVLPADFEFPDDTEIWLPLAFDANPPRASHFLLVYGRLKPGVTVTEARADMDRLAASLEEANRETNRGHGAFIEPMSERLKGPLRTSLWLLLAAVGFVLLIACVNVANLLLAKAANRRREIAVRTAVGAGRGRIAGQMLTESVVLGLTGGGAGLLVAWWAIGALRHIAPDGVAVVGLSHLRLEPRVLLFTLGLSVLTGIIFGLLPAWNLAGQDVNVALKDGGRTPAIIKRRLRMALVVSEIALASLLLVAAGLTVRSFQALLRSEPGFVSEDALKFNIALPAARYREVESQLQVFDQLGDRLRSLPGVTAVGATSHLPLGGDDARRGVSVEGREPTPDTPTRAHVRAISPDYLKAMGITLVAGRGFTSGDSASTPMVAIINETMARRYWPAGVTAIGKRVMLGGPDQPWREVVGIYKDVKFWGLNSPVNPEMLFPEAQYPFPFRVFVIRTDASDPLQLAAAIREQVRLTDPNLPVSNLRTIVNLTAESVASQRSGMLLLTVFGALALILAAAGIYGVMSHMVAVRTSEIGIRMTLGAQPSSVMGLILKEGLGQTAAGLVIGLTSGVLVMRAFRALLYGIQPADPLTVTVVAALLLATATLACIMPARRAMRIDPMQALRM